MRDLNPGSNQHTLVIYSEQYLHGDDPRTGYRKGYAVFLGVNKQQIYNYFSWKLRNSKLEFDDMDFDDMDDIECHMAFEEIEYGVVSSLRRIMEDDEVFDAWGMFPREWFEDLELFILREKFDRRQ